MARPNYGFQKRQKELAKQKKKQAKLQKKLEKSSPEDEAARIDELIEEIRERLGGLSPDSELHQTGTQLLANLKHQPADLAADLAEGFLERLDDFAPAPADTDDEP